jgi:hypothetical protein
MNAITNTLRVFIASPSDLGDERRALREVVDEINDIYSPETSWRIELLAWEETLPGRGRPQALINSDLDKADLFIGCLWQRMGSPASVGGTLTGFEEEFHRAAERSEKTGTPEMWLLFKEVPQGPRADPGPQLQKVLNFRREQTEKKQLLYKAFSTTDDWSRIMRQCLQRQLLRLVNATLNSIDVQQSAGSSAKQAERSHEPIVAPSADSTNAAFTSVADLLLEFSSSLRSGNNAMQGFAPASAARLMLLAAASYDWNAIHVELGTHEINSVYWHRSTLILTPHERLFIIRTLLLDVTDTKPGWYWTQTLKREAWLFYFATTDTEERMRVTAIVHAAATKTSLHRKSVNGIAAIAVILRSESPIVRTAGLSYLAEVGRSADGRMVTPLLADPEKEVRGEAERAKRAIDLRTRPDQEVAKSILQLDAFDESHVAALTMVLPQLTNKTLQLAVTHPSPRLRVFASKALLERNAIAKELAQELSKDAAKGVCEIGYTALARLGEPIDSEAVREALRKPDYFSFPKVHPWDTCNPDAPLIECFKRAEPEDCWRRVTAFGKQSVAALIALMRGSPDKGLDLVRSAMRDDFRQLAAVVTPTETRSTSLLSFVSTPGTAAYVEETRAELVQVALEALAKHPSPADRELFLSALSEKPEGYKLTLLALRGLSKVGLSGDRALIKPFTSSEWSPVSTVACYAYLVLSPNVSAAVPTLLEAVSPQKLWSIVSVGLQSKESASLWPLLEPLLKADNEDVRRMTAYFAIGSLSRKRLLKLLDAYLSSGIYYYNVVTQLDRALFAPSAFRKKFRDDEMQRFRKWNVDGVPE